MSMYVLDLAARALPRGAVFGLTSLALLASPAALASDDDDSSESDGGLREQVELLAAEPVDDALAR